MSTVYACPLSYSLISLTGKDKLSYLHGQITQDINKLTDDNFLWAGHCNAKASFGVYLGCFHTLIAITLQGQNLR